MVVRVEVKVKPTIRALAAFEESVNKITDEEMQFGAEIIVGRTSFYPPPPPTSDYDRTGIYGATFAIQKVGEGQRLLSSHAVQKGRGYSPFVGGGETGIEQVGIHAKTGWRVFLTEAQDEAINTAERIEDKLDKFAKSQGL